MIKSSTEGLEAFRAKVLERLPAASKQNMRQALSDNADQFLAQVAASIPHTTGENKDPDHVALVSTLAKTPSGDIGFKVTIGGPSAPYPMHLDAGHMTRGGEHVPAQPFWFVSLRLLKKRLMARRAKAQRDAVKAVASS